MDSDSRRYIDEKLDELFISRLTQACRWGAVIFLLLAGLDYVSTPENFASFVRYRIGIAVFLFCIAGIVVLAPKRRVLFYQALAFIAVIGSAATVEFMILQYGGHRSSYAPGMILLGLCAIGFIPARPSFNFATALIIYVVYAAPIALIEPIDDFRAFFTANAFLVSSLLSVVLIRYLSQRSLIGELGLQFDLQQQRARLEEEARDRTAQLVATIVDLKNLIAERRRSDDALKESEEKFRTLFLESKDVFYISEPQGRFLDINPAGVELFGYSSKEELLSIDIPRDLYAYPQDRKKFVDIVDRTGYARDYEVHMKRKNGERLTVLITSTAMRDKTGRLTAFRGIIRDVTERKRLEEQLLQSQKMEAVGQLAGGIAHDFNNILTAVTGYSGMVLKKLRDDDPLKLYVEHIRAAAEQAASLTHSLLAFSRKQVMNPRPVALNEIVNKVEKLLFRLIGEDIELRTVLAKGELTIVADSVQIEQVLINLATNARDAMPGGGSLTIETWEQVMAAEAARRHNGMRPGSYAVMTVTDTGTGMTDSTRQKIFEPFFTTKEVGKGTGLGLAMVYGIVKQHEGTIAVSTTPGQGTVFTVYLPLVGRRPERPDNPRFEPVMGGSETVLLGEDNDMVRFMTKSLLNDAGYTVLEAADGEEAVNCFSENRDHIDLLILDVIMPKKNGRDVYEDVRSMRPGVKVLFTSGYTADIIRTKGVIEEGLNFLQKPAAMGELLRKIRAILDAPGPGTPRSPAA